MVPKHVYFSRYVYRSAEITISSHSEKRMIQLAHRMLVTCLEVGGLAAHACAAANCTWTATIKILTLKKCPLQPHLIKRLPDGLSSMRARSARSTVPHHLVKKPLIALLKPRPPDRVVALVPPEDPFNPWLIRMRAEDQHPRPFYPCQRLSTGKN